MGDESGFFDVPLPSVTREEQEDLQKETLEFERDALVRDLEPLEYLSALRSKRVLDASDCERIRAENTRRQQSERILDMLACRGCAGYLAFCDALQRRRVQVHLLQRLNKKYGELEESFRRRKAVVLLRMQWEQENITNTELERRISEEERRNIIEAIRMGLPMPTLSSTRDTMSEVDSQDDRYPQPASSPSSIMPVETSAKNFSGPVVVTRTSSIASSASISLMGAVTPDSLGQSIFKDVGDCDRDTDTDSIPVQPFSE